jgi:hypothetical protein
MTTAEAVALGIPRWMALAMPEDVAQIVALADLGFHTPHQRRVARDYYLRCLRRDQWERRCLKWDREADLVFPCPEDK